MNSSTTGRTGVVRIAEQNFTVRQAGAVCDPKLSTTNRQHGYSATMNSVQLTVLSICPWTLQNTNPWISILTATSGTGSYSNAYALLQNTNTTERTGNVVIAGQVLTIRQLGASCAITLSPTNRPHGHGASAVTNSISVNTGAGCVWQLVHTNGWLTFLGATNGVGSNSLNYIFGANPSSSPRTAVLTVNEAFAVITQSGAPCTPDVVPNSDVHTAAAEVGNVALTLPLGCAWNVVNTNPWVVSVSPSSGNGGTNITYTLATNLNPNTRVGTLLIAGLPYTITQDGIVCSYRLSPTNRAHGFGATANTLTMNATNPCPWSVTTTNTWLTLTANSNGVGLVTNLSYSVAANPSTQERIGAIFGQGTTCIITQRGITCSYSLSPSGRTHVSAATNTTFNVFAASVCAWTVSNTNGWVTITSSTNGTGDGSVSYSITTNAGAVARSGNILVGDQLYALTQSPFTCTYKLSPTSRTHGFGATTNNVDITAGPGCAWTIATTNNWITFLSPTSGTGTLSNLNYTISANFGPGTRVGQITLVDQVLLLTQSAPTNGFQFESVTVSPAGDLNVRLGGGPAGIWELQSSTNLTNWTKIADLTNLTGRVEYHAPPPLAPMKFLRAVLP